jgi:Microtubule-binding protein MIP-T3 C-terminal region/Microtubule-binding protein MIP-T3 CH-like domain
MESYATATAQAYTGFIDNPAMNPKYLNKPPFAWILMIFTEVTKKTGFGKGLFSAEEQSKDYYTEPQMKVFALKKINALVKRVAPEEQYELTVENVVRGTECDKTNRFLQVLAIAAKKESNTDDIVSKIVEKANAAAGKGKGDIKGAASQPTKDQPAAQNLGGHQREVAEMAQGAQIEGKNRGEAEPEDPGKIRMGTLNRGGRKDTKNLDRKSDEPIDNNTQGAATIEGIKESIQNISQSINPMGKIIQFIDDDVDSMKREYDSWARIYVGAKEQLEDKEKVIEAELQPYKDKIVAKEEQIREKKGQIDSLKSKILRNNLKVKKLLGDIIGSN